MPPKKKARAAAAAAAPASAAAPAGAAAALNPHLAELKTDYLYHLGLDTTMDLRGFFGDTRFVLMGGSPKRMEAVAARVAAGLPRPPGAPALVPTGPVGKTERFVMFKVGPVLIASHGMGQPSMSILLHETAKLMRYAGAVDVTFIRIGTSGGLGVPPGTVVVSSRAVNGLARPEFHLPVLGELRRHEQWPTILHEETAAGLVAAGQRAKIRTIKGTTMGTDCFYEGQGRLDGAFCDYTEADKMAFLRRIHAEAGVANIEMESSHFAYFCRRAGIRGAVVCCTLLDRLQGDQVSSTPAELASFSGNTIAVVLAYVFERLAA